MSFFNNITRGGQLQIHQLRMFHQIFKFASMLSLVFAACFLIYQVPKIINTRDGQDGIDYAKAKFFVSTIGKFGNVNEITQEIIVDARKFKVRSSNILSNRNYIKAASNVYAHVIFNVIVAGVIFLISFVLIFVIWFKYGKSQKTTDITKGKNLVTSSELARELRQAKIASDIEINGLPLVRNSETQHILVAGTTGAGKTNLFNIMLPQIRKRGNKAIIVDVTGAYVTKFYNPDTDLIFNPLDNRSVNWNIWADCHYDSHYEAFAASVIPDKKGQDEFWEKSARIILVETLKKLEIRGKKNITELFKIFNTNDLAVLEDFLANTPAARFVAKNGDKTTQSILMNLTSQITHLKYLSDHGEQFSMRNWINNEDDRDSWLFITAKTDQLDSLRTLISTITDVAINATLSLTPSEQRRIWFIIDELPKLNKLPSMHTALAECRKYGGCIMAGIQSVPQLTEIYGHHVSQSMLDLFNSFFFFRCQNPQTTGFISNILGVVEQQEHHEQMSYGASGIKDGVSFSKQARSKSLVLPTEIANLQNLQAYVKYASHNLTLLEMCYKTLKNAQPDFVLKDRVVEAPVLDKEGQENKKAETKAVKDPRAKAGQQSTSADSPTVKSLAQALAIVQKAAAIEQADQEQMSLTQALEIVKANYERLTSIKGSNIDQLTEEKSAEEEKEVVRSLELT